MAMFYRAILPLRTIGLVPKRVVNKIASTTLAPTMTLVTMTLVTMTLAAMHVRTNIVRTCIGRASLCRTIVFAGLMGVILTSCLQGEDAGRLFHEKVEPILTKRCYACHSHRAGVMEGNLALDWRSGWKQGGDRGTAIQEGKPNESLLIQAVLHDGMLRMPEERLPQEEIDVLMEWVRSGAFDDRIAVPSQNDTGDWWSLRPLKQPSLPKTIPLESSNPIDAFLNQRWMELGLVHAPMASRRDLIQRVYFDLTGLPPSYDQVVEFESDPDPLAYEKLVDRLLESPRYGERWARHWMDAIHFADSHGYEHDIGRDHAWPYRDYLIRSLNQDKSWGRMIREQLAVDVCFPDRPEDLPALGFLGAGTFDLSTFSTGPITFEYLDRDDMVTQTMSAFMSTTANCARCHAHKFDPISQEDYYALQAVFAGIAKGDVPYDSDPEVAKQRTELNRQLLAARQLDRKVLSEPGSVELCEAWLAEMGTPTPWEALNALTFISTEGATLNRLDEAVFLASGISPDKDTYSIVATSRLKRITAIRLDVLPHDSLPMQGPGRCHNGNLHLSEIECWCFAAGSSQAKKIGFSKATADFNQTDWGIERAIDGNVATAWGIHPAVGIAHHAVFELSEPLDLDPNTHLEIRLRQLHGGSHLLGSFRLSATDLEPSRAVALPIELERVLAKPGSERSLEETFAIRAFALKNAAERAMRALPPQDLVYAVGTNVQIPVGDGKYQSHSIGKPKTVHLLHRGDFDKPKDPIPPGAISALKHLPGRFVLKEDAVEGERRAALAEWIAHEENGLTWRSIVNRVWHHHFGKGLCDTPSDFGHMGGVPSHPELIDYLAVWFRDEAKGSLKALHRLIMTSYVYKLSSEGNDEGAWKSKGIDAENRYLWRQNRQRLDADAVRDYALTASGKIDLTMYGMGAQHFKQSKGPQSTPALDYASFDWKSFEANRRSIYRYVWRGIADPFMESLDFPDLGLLSPTRGNSTSALQALTLWNNDFVLACSEQMAAEAEKSEKSLEDQVQWCVRRTWLRECMPAECDQFTRFAKTHGLAAICRLLFNSNEFLFVN